MIYSDRFSILFKLIGLIVGRVGNYHIFILCSVATEYLIYGRILLDVIGQRRLTGAHILILLVLKLAMLPMLMSISAMRNTLAYSFFVQGIYCYYRRQKLSPRAVIWMLAGVLTHTSVIVSVLIFAGSLPLRKRPKLVLLVPLLGGLIAALIQLSGRINVAYIQYLYQRIEFYMQPYYGYDAVKRNSMILWFVPLLLIMLYKYIKYRDRIELRAVTFIVLLAATALAVYRLSSLLFLRLLYPLSMLMPIFMGEVKAMENGNRRTANRMVLFLVPVCVAAFVLTRYCWLYEVFLVYEKYFAHLAHFTEWLIDVF